MLKNWLMAMLLLSLVACGSDDYSEVEKAEAAQAGVTLIDKTKLNRLDDKPLTAETAKEVCAYQLAALSGGQTNNPVFQEACDCIVGRVGLAAFNQATDAKRAAGVSFENRGVVIDFLEADQSLLSTCTPFL